MTDIKRFLHIVLLLTSFNLLSLKTFSQTKPAWVTPHAATLVTNPFATDKATLTEGKKLYTINCSPCHGMKGKGDGPAAVSLNPKPADHTSAKVQSETDGSLFWKISEGRAPMPPYKVMLSQKQRWELINYIRTLAATPKN